MPIDVDNPSSFTSFSLFFRRGSQGRHDVFLPGRFRDKDHTAAAVIFREAVLNSFFRFFTVPDHPRRFISGNQTEQHIRTAGRIDRREFDSQFAAHLIELFISDVGFTMRKESLYNPRLSKVLTFLPTFDLLYVFILS